MFSECSYYLAAILHTAMARSSVNQEQSHRVYDPDGDQEGCPFCEDKPSTMMCTALKAVGSLGGDPAWDNQEEKVDGEVTEQAEQWREQQEQVERSEVADTTEELKTISLELSSCVAPPFLPSPQQLPMSCHTCHLLETTGRPSQQGCW
jgi:hypothetical protein